MPHPVSLAAGGLTGTVFRRLWRLALDVEPSEPGQANYALFDDYGLALHDPLTNGGDYKADRLSLLTFASTGGDGVHFAFFSTDETWDESCPVVMVVPMAFEPHWVVGESLEEFLGLGARVGFFALEQLAYDFKSTCRKIATSSVGTELSSQFRLVNPTDVASRIQRLNGKYLPLLKHS